MKNLLIFASGSKDGGGSGFENLVNSARNGTLQANIVAVVSNHGHGGVRERADRLGIPFIHFPAPYSAENYQKIVRDTNADFIALSGWLKFVEGLPADKTFNIHPAWLPSPFAGKNFYGHHIHEAVLDAYKKGEPVKAGVSMHFVTDKYDDDAGLFFRKSVEILPDDTVETLAKRVNEVEHKWQPIMTNKVVTGEISWDGKNSASLKGVDVEN
ncbi:MAG TPA: formyltransferase family protein [Candidatus Paceibacterota bacterium]|nr:formyltransferase family protein [Candidatus Paceibacterota bacterium]